MSQADVSGDVLLVGRVVEVRGREVRIAVDSMKNRSHLLFQGEVIQNVAVGGYLKIHKGFSRLIGKIDGESIREVATRDYQSKSDRMQRVLEVNIVGYLDSTGRFKRGIRELPLIDNECFVLSREEFASVHSFVGPRDDELILGTLPMQNGLEVGIGVDAIFASHIGIFGNTGSGKSYTLAKLYYELLRKYESSPDFRSAARFAMLDFNGEYVDLEEGSSVIANQEMKHQYVLTTRRGDGDKLPMSRETVMDSAFWIVLLDATEKTQAPFLQRTLDSGFWDERLRDNETLAVEIARLMSKAVTDNDPQNKSVLTKFVDDLHQCVAEDERPRVASLAGELRRNLKYHGVSKTFYMSIPGATNDIWANAEPERFDAYFVERIQGLQLDLDAVSDVLRIRLMIVLQYYSDVINGYANREHLAPLMKRLERRAPRIQRLIYVSDENQLLPKPLTVISLRDVEIDMKKVIPLLLCKQLYDEQKDQSAEWDYLGLIIDEAHNILSTSSVRESETWKDYRLETFEEIVKEGRKFGVFLTIASQRPFDISSTITSQLHNYFLHRLVNSLDIKAIEHAVSYLDKVSFDSLPILPVGTCIMSGVSTQIPVIVEVDALPPAAAPNSSTPELVRTWRDGPLGRAEGDDD